MTPTPSERVERLLALGDVPHTIVRHRETFSSVDEARTMGLPAEQTAKVVVLLDGATYLAAVVPACEHADLEKVRAALRCSPGLRLAAESEIRARFPAFEAGALPPMAEFASVVFDQRLLTYNRVLCPAGDHSHSALADPDAIVRATNAVVADVVT
ncbi:MAG: aminoacyl-tRNA deacylase [Solirubrobacteraceae bacterium]